MPQVHSNGLTLEVETFGSASDPAMLLIMGLGCQLVVWPDALCVSLAAAGYHVIRFDNRDIGLSAKIAGAQQPKLFRNILRSMLGLKVHAPYTLQAMVLDSLGLLDALGIARAHIVGLSMGGMIGQLLALQHADRVLSLTSIMSTSGNPRLPQASLKMQLRLIRRPKSRAREALIEHSTESWKLLASPKAVPPEAERRALATRTVDRSIYPRGYVHQLLAILASGSRHQGLPAIKVPTLIVHGAEDPLIPAAAAYELQQLIPGARLALLMNMGHNLPTSLLPQISALLTQHAETA